MRTSLTAGIAKTFISITLPTISPTQTDPWKYTIFAPCCRPASGTSAGKKMSGCGGFAEQKEFGTSCTSGGIAAFTIGPGGGPWRGCTWSKGANEALFLDAKRLRLGRENALELGLF